MKSAHRHDLETNELAKRMAVVIDRAKPYASTLTAVAVALVVCFLVFSYLSGSSSARQSEAWNAYITAMESPIYNLQVFDESMEMLKQSAEEHAGTRMQQWADVTWADGQVWRASSMYTRNRAAAMESLERATTAYQSVIRTSDDQRLVGRAHFGLARVREMQNRLDEAKEEYGQVHGGFAELAKMRAANLDESDLQAGWNWLATAEPLARSTPLGPGVPGQQPEFGAEDLQMTEPSAGDPNSIEDLLNRLDFGTDADDTNRYEPGGEPAADETTPAGEKGAGTTSDPILDALGTPADKSD